MQKDVKFQLEDAVEYPEWCDNYPEHKFTVFKCCFLSTKPNAHNLDIGDDVLRRDAQSILGNMLVAKIQNGDATTHLPSEIQYGYFPREQEIEFVEEHMVDLATLLPARPDIDKVNEMLEAALTGAEYQDENTSRSSAAVSEEDERVIDSLINNVMKTRRTPIKEETEEAPPWEDSPKTKPSTKKPASVAKADNDDDDDDDDEFDEDALLEQLRNRSKK